MRSAKLRTGRDMFLTICSPRSSKPKSLQRLDLLMHRSRDADAAGLGERFEPRRDIYPGAVDVLALGDDLAEIDAHAEQKPPVGGTAAFRSASAS